MSQRWNYKYCRKALENDSEDCYILNMFTAKCKATYKFMRRQLARKNAVRIPVKKTCHLFFLIFVLFYFKDIGEYSGILSTFPLKEDG